MKIVCVILNNIIILFDNHKIITKNEQSFMSKFNKTSYSRAANYNNFMHTNLKNDKKQSRDGSRGFQRKRDQPKQQFMEKIKQETSLHNVVEKKIQIDPALLFTHKSSVKQEKQTRDKRSITRQAITRDIDRDRQYNMIERPQSKQQSRIKINVKLQSSKQMNVSDRPQTSKGQRNVAFQRKNDQDLISNKIKLNQKIEQVGQKKKIHPMSAKTRKTPLKPEVQFQTSLDPEFLSLFAS